MLRKRSTPQLENLKDITGLTEETRNHFIDQLKALRPIAPISPASPLHIQPPLKKIKTSMSHEPYQGPSLYHIHVAARLNASDVKTAEIFNISTSTLHRYLGKFLITFDELLKLTPEEIANRFENYRVPISQIQINLNNLDLRFIHEILLSTPGKNKAASRLGISPGYLINHLHRIGTSYNELKNIEIETAQKIFGFAYNHPNYIVRNFPNNAILSLRLSLIHDVILKNINEDKGIRDVIVSLGNAISTKQLKLCLAFYNTNYNELKQLTKKQALEYFGKSEYNKEMAFFFSKKLTSTTKSTPFSIILPSNNFIEKQEEEKTLGCDKEQNAHDSSTISSPSMYTHSPFCLFTPTISPNPYSKEKQTSKTQWSSWTEDVREKNPDNRPLSKLATKGEAQEDTAPETQNLTDYLTAEEWQDLENIFNARENNEDITVEEGSIRTTFQM